MTAAATPQQLLLQLPACTCGTIPLGTIIIEHCLDASVRSRYCNSCRIAAAAESSRVSWLWREDAQTSWAIRNMPLKATEHHTDEEEEPMRIAAMPVLHSTSVLEITN